MLLILEPHPPTNERELTVGHQRQLKDLHEDHRFVITSLETRDTKNAQEIQTLHKKCRCLTNLFEEMRMRYERRDPRPEDLQQIEELKSVIDSQDRDLRLLTEQFREMQLHERELQQRLYQQQQVQKQSPPQAPRRAKNRSKQQHQQQNDPIVIEEDEQQQPQQQQQPQPQIQNQPMVASVPIVCDVIYEENEADLIQEEEQHTTETENQNQHIEQPCQIVEQQQQNHEEIIVDLPESAIETLIDVVQSTEPVFIDPSSASEPNTSIGDGSSNSTEPEVIQINCLPESKPLEPEVTISIPTPAILITTENEESIEPESSEVCISTVVELPVPVPSVKVVVQDQSPSVPDRTELQTEVQQKLQSMPEMIVIREPDVMAEAKTAVAASGDVAPADDVLISAPGLRSSST